MTDENWLQCLAEAVSDVVWVADLSLRITRVSPSIQRMLGFTAEQYCSRSFRDNYPARYVDHFMHLLRDEVLPAGPGIQDSELRTPNLELRTSKPLEVEHYRSDGSLVSIALDLAVIRDDKGQAVELQGTMRDISERRRLELELQRQGRLPELLLGNVSSFINPPFDRIDETVETALGRLGDFFGADRAYLSEYDFERQTCTATHEWCARGIKPQKDSMQTVPLSVLLGRTEAHRSGTEMHVPDISALAPDDPLRALLEPQEAKSHISVPLMNGKNCLGFIGFDSIRRHREYTETERRQLETFAQMLVELRRRRETEKALRVSEERFRGVMDNAGIGIVLISPDMRVLQLNRQMRDWYPVAAKTVAPVCYRVFGTPPQKLPCPDCPVRLTLQDARVHEGELEVATVEGMRIHRVVTSPILAEPGGATAAIALVEDITERKRAEATIAVKSREFEQIIYAASHDLRSPLVNADGYSRELENYLGELQQLAHQDKLALAPLRKKLATELPDMLLALGYIRSSTKQMDTLLKGLLKFSRSGRAELSIVPLDMNLLIPIIVSSLRFQIRQTDAMVHIGKLPDCQADEAQVMQVFSNLLGNALKYLEPGRPGEIKITGTAEHGHALYRVEDNGIGIALKHQKKIFELFYRLNPAESEGEGLGLTIVRQILGRMNGTVRVESNFGKGSRFYVTLPRARDSEPA